MLIFAVEPEFEHIGVDPECFQLILGKCISWLITQSYDQQKPKLIRCQAERDHSADDSLLVKRSVDTITSLQARD